MIKLMLDVDTTKLVPTLDFSISAPADQEEAGDILFDNCKIFINNFYVAKCDDCGAYGDSDGIIQMYEWKIALHHRTIKRISKAFERLATEAGATFELDYRK